MPRYCLDTSWISTPLLEMPPDVHVSLWSRIRGLIEGGAFCWNTEIWDELDGSIQGDIGECLKACNGDACFEVGADHWDWKAYLEHIERVRVDYQGFISEYNGNRKNTVGFHDCSIVCLAKTLALPVASMEKRGTQPSVKKLRIPDLCDRMGIEHFDLTDLMRAEGLTA